MKMSKAAIYFWLAFLTSVTQAPTIVSLNNDPSLIHRYGLDEWIVMGMILVLYAVVQGLIALRALGSNPNTPPNGKDNETKPTNGTPSPTPVAPSGTTVSS